MHNSILRPLGSAALLILFAFVIGSGQELRGKITGRVMDPNGAAVPGASVKVIDVAKNSTANLTTNGDGLFDAPYLFPGKYQVLVEVAGFKKSLHDNVIVEINQTRTLNISLEVGGTQETVTVTAEAATLNQADANLGPNHRPKAAGGAAAGPWRSLRVDRSFPWRYLRGQHET